MKNIFLSILIGLLSLSASAQTSFVEDPNKKQSTISLTKKDFLKKINNYEINKNNFVYAGDKPCIIDFYTTWCGPCKRLAPILEELAKTYDKKLYIYKIDAEKELELAYYFGINSYPTLIFIPMDGKPQILKGALPKEQLTAVINDIFKF